jgi:predicted nucleic-acid-binding protein
MIGIDTNILVRYFTQDNLEQAQIVEQIIDNYATSPNSLFINNIVMCELIWVLESGYKYSKEAISAVIKQMLSTEEFAFENQELLWLALNQYNQNKLDFSDALIGAINKDFGCSETLTFDQTAIRANNFKLAE